MEGTSQTFVAPKNAIIFKNRKHVIFNIQYKLASVITLYIYCLIFPQPYFFLNMITYELFFLCNKRYLNA